jgi:hypothetical protein
LSVLIHLISGSAARRDPLAVVSDRCALCGQSGGTVRAQVAVGVGDAGQTFGATATDREARESSENLDLDVPG